MNPTIHPGDRISPNSIEPPRPVDTSGRVPIFRCGALRMERSLRSIAENRNQDVRIHRAHTQLATGWPCVGFTMGSVPTPWTLERKVDNPTEDLTQTRPRPAVTGALDTPCKTHGYTPYSLQISGYQAEPLHSKMFGARFGLASEHEAWLSEDPTKSWLSPMETHLGAPAASGELC
ncbi:hypothetical protein LX36DRAFT_283434 [Colletotrichum falcatum]|nr:hypothetical protein LX36DRAFT_283434 [Colletotrichum falcatum]